MDWVVIPAGAGFLKGEIMAEKMMMKITPNNTILIIEDRHNGFIAKVQDCDEEDIANARHLAKCWNMHDKLVKALKNLLEDDLLKDEYHIAGRQALAEAEEE